MVSSSEILDIIEIIFFVPALLVAIYVCIKHGFAREAGWLLLVTIAAVRIAGAGTGIAGEQQANTGLLIASIVLGGIGSATLVAALTGVVNRIDSGSNISRLPPRARKLLGIIAIVAIVLGALSGSKVASSDPETRAQGYVYVQVAAVFIFVQFLATAFILSLQLLKMNHVLSTDRRLCFAAAAAAPFVFVRTVYSICAAFDHNSPAFSTRSRSTTAIILKAVLGVVMEILASALLLIGGVLAPKIQVGQNNRAQDFVHLEPYRHKDAENSGDHEQTQQTRY